MYTPTYTKNLPGILRTGYEFVFNYALKPGFSTGEHFEFVDNIDATMAMPAGSTKYSDWGSKWEPMPYHQSQSHTIRGQ